MRRERARVGPLPPVRAVDPELGSGVVFCDECPELAIGCLDGAPLCLDCLCAATRRRLSGAGALRRAHPPARAAAC